MEVLIVLIVIGAAAYYFFKGNVKRGAETVRASIYLTGIQAGATVAEANLVAGIDITVVPTPMLHNAMEHLRVEYGGRQIPMIADAYRQGMHPKLPLWYQVAINILHPNTPDQVSVPTAVEWTASQERNQMMSFDEYLHTVVTEVKRLDGKAVTDLHWVELVDDDGTKRAYADGIDPRILAVGIINLGPPPL